MIFSSSHWPLSILIRQNNHPKTRTEMAHYPRWSLTGVPEVPSPGDDQGHRPYRWFNSRSSGPPSSALDDYIHTARKYLRIRLLRPLPHDPQVGRASTHDPTAPGRRRIRRLGWRGGLAGQAVPHPACRIPVQGSPGPHPMSGAPACAGIDGVFTPGSPPTYEFSCELRNGASGSVHGTLTTSP